MSNGQAELLSHALVREYLVRRGYRKALGELDAARPVSAGDITSRADIAQSLRLEELLRASRTARGTLSTMLEHVVDARLADCARRIRGSTDSDSDDSESDKGRTWNDDDDDDNDEENGNGDGNRPTLSVSLPMGGPLGQHLPSAQSRPLRSTSARPASARPQSGRPASARPQSDRPASARPDSAIGARTPHTVGGRAFGPITVSELPSTTRARTMAASGGGGGGVGDFETKPAVNPAKAISFTGRRSERIVISPGEVNGGTVSLEFLDSCDVLVLDWSSQVTVDACTSCRLLFGPVDGSVMLRECVGLHVSAVCRQLRCRDCDTCELRLFTLGPIIESSQRMTFGRWNVAYPKLASHFAAASINPRMENKWSEVHDFNDPGGNTNWSTLVDGPTWTIAVVPGDEEGVLHGRCENPIPQHGLLVTRCARVTVSCTPSGERSCMLQLRFRSPTV